MFTSHRETHFKAQINKSNSTIQGLSEKINNFRDTQARYKTAEML